VADLKPHKNKWRWAAGLLVLLIYVAGLGYLGAKQVVAGNEASPLLPDSAWGLILVCASEVILFGLAFLLFWILTRATKEDLKLRVENPLRLLRRGLLYSIGLRAFIAIILMVIMVLMGLTSHKTGRQLQDLRPQTENLVDFAALINDPLYFALAITLVSFVLGGFREELWRVSVFAACEQLLPARWSGAPGKIFAVIIAAIVFGLGHLSQGWGGVLMTGLLGVGLGWIIIRHNSLWEAALAHGFFDATSFSLLYLLARYFPEALK
jgi:membrane protease YdiL (CAAX protease family)